MEQHKRNDNFEHALLVIDSIGLAVESGDFLQVPPSAFFLEERFTATGAKQVLAESSELMLCVLCSLEL